MKIYGGKLIFVKSSDELMNEGVTELGIIVVIFQSNFQWVCKVVVGDP